MLHWHCAPVHYIYYAPVHKWRSIQTCFAKVGLEELKWPAQNPNLNLTEPLWDELER